LISLAALSCIGNTYDHATYNTTANGTNANGICLVGYASAANVTTRACTAAGNWSALIYNRCLGVKTCPADAVTANASWPVTVVGNTATANCLTGYSGGPLSRACPAASTWSSTVTGTKCVRNICPQDTTTGYATWPATNAALTTTATTVSGTCNTGYSGSPTRTCNSTGGWSTVKNPCVGERSIFFPPFFFFSSSFS